ncbi:MAG: YidC/Oxa1 family membrane protein insertase [Dehalococcoidia bacterium]|nr:YidC/Oxa1 family membrane protein insertase [Dehalococcoidia bacterium]
MEIFGLLWTEIIMRPMINSLALLYQLLFQNFGISIIVFTIVIRILMIPLTIRQYHQMKKMQLIQPRMKALQEKYKDKSREAKQKMSKETMALYKEIGVNPIGCLGPMFIQMPIWIGLYRAIIRTIPGTPEGLANLSTLLYGWNPGVSSVPLNSMFFGINLADFVSAAPLPMNFFMPILVGVSMWVMQKMTTVPSTDPRQRQTNQMMLWMMPIMFGVFTFQFPSGLAIYILFSNIVGIVIQYFISGKESLSNLNWRTSSASSVTDIKNEANYSNETKSQIKDGNENGEEIHGQKRRRSNRRSSTRNRRRTRRP